MTTKTHPSVAPSRRIRWLILASLLAVTALAYWPGTHGAFLIDDFPNIVQNNALKNLKPSLNSFISASMSSNSGPTHRPIAMASFALNVLLDGGGKQIGHDATAMKWTNVGIHLLNGLLVFILLRLLLAQYRRLRPETSETACEWAVLVITAAWLLAPINLTSVLYVVQRMTSLAGSFSLLGLIAYTAGRSRLQDNRQPARAWALLLSAALVWTPLAIFTKEVGALTLLYALVIEWTLFRVRQESRRHQFGIAIYFAIFLIVPAICALAWLLPQSLKAAPWAVRPFTLGERLLTEGRVIWHYIWGTLVPDIQSLSLYHDAYPVSRSLLKPWTTLASWVGIGGLLASAIWARRRYPLIAFGVLWFLAGQVMTASFLPLELVFEHREYLPSLGLYTAGFGTLVVLTGKNQHRKLVLGSMVAIVALYGMALSLRSLNWSNPIRQLAVAAREHPDSPRATYGYGRILALYANVDPKLVPAAHKALEKAARVPHQGLLPYATLIILAQRNHLSVNPEWYYKMAHLLESRPANPGDISAIYSLVHCALIPDNPCKLDPDLMQLVFASALTRPHPNTTIMIMYGNYLLNAAGRPHQARKIFSILVQQDPHNAIYHYNLGVADVGCGNIDSARHQLAILRRLNHFGLNTDNIKSLSDLITRAQKN